MTILPSQINDVLRLYTKISRVSSAVDESAPAAPKETQDIISISTEGKRKQVMEEIKQNVLKKIKESAE
jgi:hypothetical protein